MRKKIIAFFVAAVVMLMGYSFSSHAADVTNITQAEEGYFVRKFSGTEFASYRSATGYTEPRLGNPDVSEHDYLFAGWYKDQACTSPYTASAREAVNDKAYAKFVSADVMRVKCVVTEGTTAESETTNLRMISTVDSVYYSEMGFNVNFKGKTIPCVEERGYARISGAEGLQVGYSPVAFHSNSKYFFTHRLIGITQENFDEFFTVQPYWVTTDGTTVQGVARCLKVSDSYNKVLNLPIHLDSNDKVTGEHTIRVEYASEQFLLMKDSVAGDLFDSVSYAEDDKNIIAITIKADNDTVLDGMLGNLRFQLKKDALLDSTTTFTVQTNSLNITDLAYRNYAIGYNGNPDTSWYVGFEDNDNFVVSTVADLQGLAQLVNQGNSFDNTTIILGADIIGNPSTVIRNGEIVDAQAAKVMIPIGTYKDSTSYAFNGTFDGGNHTISGLYISSSGYCGLFGECGADSVIQNLNISNSYYKNDKKYTAAVAGRTKGNIINVCVDSDVKIVAQDNVGGIVGYSSAPNSDVSISDCWFSGDIHATRYAGGMIGVAQTGTTKLSNCLYDGSITCSYSDTSYAFLGGMCGLISRSTPTTVLDVDSCISVGEILDSNTGKGVGAVVGVVHNKNTELGTDSKLIVKNMFAARDSVSCDVGNSNPVMQGVVTWTNQKDRLMAYCTQATVGEETPSLSLDSWTMRKSGVPIPATLANVLTEADIVSTSTLNTELGFDTTDIELNLANALNTGLGNYTLTKTDVEPSTITAYRAALVALGFEELYKNGVTVSEGGDVTYGVYNGSFVKDDGNWLLHVIYSSFDKVLNITISTEGRGALSPRLNSSNIQAAKESDNSVKLAMLSLQGSQTIREDFTYCYGNSFVFSLPQEGHYIISDGGNKTDLEGLLEYVRRNPDAEGNVYIDAWIVSHQHSDHFALIESVYNDPSLIDGVYVEAFYINEPNATTYAGDSVDMDVRSHNQRLAMALFRTAPTGESSKVYRMSTGQKYYFDGLSMDVILTHDVMNRSLITTYDVSAVNRSSAVVLFTTDDGRKIFIGGDADRANMRYIVSMYGKDDNGYTSSALLQGIDVFVALHHGKNSSYAASNKKADNTFVNYLTTDESRFTYVLYPCSFMYGVEKDLSEEETTYAYAGPVNEYMNTRTTHCRDYGDGHVIINLGTMTDTVE